MTLRIRQQDYEAMRCQCEQAYPAEACGILLGHHDRDERRVEQIVPCRNTHSDCSRRYSIDPVELIRVQRQARERGREIVGFYHSHPDHPAQWSQADLEDAHWIGYSFVITSIEQGKATETRSFFLNGTGEESKGFAAEIVAVEGQN